MNLREKWCVFLETGKMGPGLGQEVYWIIYSVLKGHQMPGGVEIEDVCQLVMEKLLRYQRKGGRFRQYDAPQVVTFIRRTAMNQLRDLVKEAKAQKRAKFSEVKLESLKDKGVEIEDGAPGPESQALAKERYAQLNSALREIPLQERQAFVWTRGEGVSQREVAQRLNMPYHPVKLTRMVKRTEKALYHRLIEAA